MTEAPRNSPEAEISARNDRELVEATLAGDRSAFDRLVERYEKKIYNLALGVTGHTEDALDATQGAFLKAYQNLPRFDPAHRFFSWIYRISLNEALDIVSRRRRFSPLDQEIASRSAGPEERSSGKEIGREIREALLELSPELRVTVILRHFHGLSYSEMGEVIGVPAKTVKSRLFTARRELRRRLLAKGFARARS